MTREEVVEKLRLARDIHAKIATQERGASAEENARLVVYEEAVGDPAWHDSWVKVYDEAIALLLKPTPLQAGFLIESTHYSSPWYDLWAAGELPRMQPLDAKDPEELDAKGPDS